MTDPTQPPMQPDRDADPELEAGADDAEYEDDQPRNPFDNPWFLPLMFGAFALWCGYDGFVSDKYLERPSTLWFNRIAFGVLGALATWLGLRARREVQAAKGP
jgi:hypothetical protein